jgi:hypothetical protein
MTMRRYKNVFFKGGVGLVISLASVCVVLPAAGSDDKGTKNAKEMVGVIKRDPFWPVGYVPKEAVLAATQKSTADVPAGSWKEAMKMVSIDGISRSAGSEYYAVINGQIKSAGDTVSVRLGNSLYTWAVDSIEAPGSVKLRRLTVR